MKSTYLLKNESGMALVIALVIMTVLTLIGLASTFTSTFEILLSGEKRRSTDAFYSADSGGNILVRNYLNFVPGRVNYNPFTDQNNPNPNPTNVTARIDFDPLKIGPQAGDSFSMDYSYFWVESTGRDNTGSPMSSTCTVNLNVVRKILPPGGDSITEVIVN